MANRPFCVRCERAYGDDVRRSGRTRYCETCHAALRAAASHYCTHCRRDVPTSQYVYSRSRCRACAHPTVVGRSRVCPRCRGVIDNRRYMVCKACRAEIRASSLAWCAAGNHQVLAAEMQHDTGRRICAACFRDEQAHNAALPPGVTRCTCCGILIGPGFLETTNYAGRCGSCVRWHSRHTPQPMVFDEEL